MTKKFL